MGGRLTVSFTLQGTFQPELAIQVSALYNMYCDVVLRTLQVILMHTKNLKDICRLCLNFPKIKMP